MTIQIKTLKDICELFDAEVMRELVELPYTEELTDFYYIGWPDGPAIEAGDITPVFPTETDLLDWCKSDKGQARLEEEGLRMYGDEWEEA